MHNQDDKELEAKNRKIAIHMDDDEPPTDHDKGGDDNGHELPLELKATKQDGEDFEMKYSFDGDDSADFFLTTVEGDEEFEGMLRWLFLLSLAGARTFAD